MKKDLLYIQLLILHVIIGAGLYAAPSLSNLYGILMLLGGVYVVIKSKNTNNEVLLVSAYLVGGEVILRMAQSSLSYEFSKYGVTLFMLLGMYFSGFSKNSVPYWIFLLLLIPGIIIATFTLNLHSDYRTILVFNISGPVCLGVASIYCYSRKILLSTINDILLMVLLPVISTTTYLFLYTPDLKEVLTGTGSNFETSGGFGPNQVSTILGIGIFVAFARILFNSKSKIIIAINILILLAITYRGLITFSRGGVLTGFMMIPVLLFFLYINTKSNGRLKLSLLLGVMIIALSITWTYTSFQTNGLIDKRYANKDAMGRVKEDKFSGREEIWDSEINAFLENPVFGIGVGKGVEFRENSMNGLSAVSHNEISRMLAEHGALGIMGMFILFLTPVILFLDNKQHIYMFCFMIFWLLTINHAAMRIAAPAFVYSLSLLKVRFDDNL
jgi:O-antigen ligase